jgi:hypothetical protein
MAPEALAARGKVIVAITPSAIGRLPRTKTIFSVDNDEFTENTFVLAA